MTIDAVLSIRLRSLRKSRHCTLDQLAELSGVSRSMISLIERQETSPTAAVLNKLADALGVSLPALFSQETGAQSPNPLSQRSEQSAWTDPDSGYVRRHLSPQGGASPIELVEVCFPPGESVTFETTTRRIVTHQQIWVLEGEMQITTDQKVWHLQTGDCLALVLGPRIVFHNPTTHAARYLLALTNTHSHTSTSP